MLEDKNYELLGIDKLMMQIITLKENREQSSYVFEFFNPSG